MHTHARARARTQRHYQQRSWVWGIIATNYAKWFYDSEDSNVGFFRIMVPWEPKDPANVAMLPKEARGVPCPTDKAGYQVQVNDCGRVKFLSAESWEPFVMFRKVEADGEPSSPRYSEAYIGRFK